MNTQYRGDQLVHFDGDWPARERSLVEMVVLKAERTLDLPVPEGLFGRPWICTLQRDGENEEYFARRINLRLAIQARTAGALIDQLRNQVGYRRRNGI